MNAVTTFTPKTQRQQQEHDAGRVQCDEDWAAGTPLDLGHAAVQGPHWRTGYRLRHSEHVTDLAAS